MHHILNVIKKSFVLQNLLVTANRILGIKVRCCYGVLKYYWLRDRN